MSLILLETFSTKGIFTIADGDSEASFDVHLLPDDIPEIEEKCMCSSLFQSREEQN